MWSQNLVALVQWFAPASVVMTFDKKSCGDLEDVVQKDTKSGDISKLLFPERIIVTANHQVRVGKNIICSAQRKKSINIK